MYAKFIKRLFDIFFSLFGLIILFVVFLFVAPFIFLEDKGPIFYNAKRLGRNGKVFKMYKFRTMKVNSSDIRNKDGSTYNGNDDPRLTKVGRFLRKTSIDELPQFINVFIGNMSIIGPRPDLPEHIHEYNKTEKRKLEVLPGITGYNQAFFRNSISWHERLKNDVYYVENISFLLDVKIVFKTIKTVLCREKIYITNNRFTMNKLDWDTDYFGVECGKIVLMDSIDNNDIKIIKKWIKNFDFVIVSNLNNNNINNLVVSQLKPFLADVNVQFKKSVSDVDADNKNIYIEDEYKGNKELLNIAKKAYKYSRFLNDDRLDVRKSKILYYNWLKNSFNKKGKIIAYYKKNNRYLGYCLFHIEENTTCVIELIAVDNSYAKKGIGTLLITSVEKYCFDNKVCFMEVGTQMQNISAQNFYIKNGFKVESYNPTYHIWRKK